MTTGVDRRSPLPLYIQLENALLAYIRSEGLTAGDQLPTEGEIAIMYSVSRATIRQALGRLVNDGYVERVQGLGSFVAKPRPQHTPLLTSFTENMQVQGYDVQRRVLESSVVATPTDAQAGLGIGEGQCQRLLRLFIADGDPIGVSETWITLDSIGEHPELFTLEYLEGRSLYSLIEGPEIGLRLDRGMETIRAGLAQEREQRLLGCEPGDPTLIMTRSSYTASGRAVEWTIMTFRADHYEYQLELRRPN